VVAQLIGAFDDEAQRATMLTELRRLVDLHGAHEVIVANNGLRFIPGLAEQCLTQGVRVVPASVLVERYMGRVPLSDIDSHWYLGLPDNDLWDRPYSVVRRLGDLLLASIVSIPFLLVLPLLIVMIKIETPGPAFIKQRRAGQHGRAFELLKLRTMRLDAELAGAQFTSAKDPRVTRVGRVLRKIHLDEVPQMLNIVRGDMGLIGPRPERPELMTMLESEIPGFRARLLVKPGLTGWAQVKGGYASTIPDFIQKLEYDAYYIKNRSLRLDMQILSNTLVSVIGFKGR
jgi:lipopolysaccharide/colanic/teichoic acid biosynthesis glycosyltransferase